MNVNKVVVALGGAAIGVGGTLLAQRLRKEVEIGSISETVDPPENLAYREAAAATLTSVKPSPAKPTPKKNESQLDKENKAS